MLYKIKYRRLVEGKWDGIFHTSKIEAPNEYQAVYHLGTYSEENEEYEIVMVSSTNGNPATFSKDYEYITLGGSVVTMQGISNPGTSYETLYDEHGHHRYSKRDFGRCTGSKGNEPSNIQLGVFWLKMDVNDNYDFIMERPYDSHE
ncbi:hypothetical protein YenMTG1_102 [Yersinia phage vB_YenM_TG1]|uniref:Uncharacterized protein n=1 Tax=Yersinia phage vB_YenM_TG1 TaxID=1589265 RepID=A0A0B4ZXA2_9CAUD|nr:hypothetical protein AVV33_gp102 [Yersinia phage vB_YenM_TG1]AJD81912.1 hypothetical protein YenMTG1_102 [Yersinia phage vB_YenM_TG1]